MKMESLRFSKFKLQLQALITQVRELKERDRTTTDQIHRLIQKHKQIEDECGRKLQELQSELASSDDLRKKLERQVTYLQNDNDIHECKHKELQGSIQNLIQSREAFISVYQESTCEMKRSIEAGDRRVAFLNEKINGQSQLLNSIEKEASAIKQLVNNVQCVLNEKEQVVAGLRNKMSNVSTFEKAFIEKIHELESGMKDSKDELRRKDIIISDLKAQLEEAKISNSNHHQLEELQINLSAKEVIIQNLVHEKKALHFELGNLGRIFQKVQQTVVHMNEEDKQTFSLILECQEENAMAEEREDDRNGDAVQSRSEYSFSNTFGKPAAEKTASSPCPEYNSISNTCGKNDKCDHCLSELQLLVCLPQPASSEPQLAANVKQLSEV